MKQGDWARLGEALEGRYRLERELGAGGMATVLLAEDLKHDRKVAIKVLKPELAAVLGAERFVQEIKTTAALSHPHILPLFDSGEAGGQLYYVMPYIEGETIRDKVNRETQFGIEEAVRITAQVADALDYAHRHGVIHRDIKPENILLHDGRALVMDFGIALAVSAAAGGRMTETGLSLGTPHYMSPEQATADKAITARRRQEEALPDLYLAHELWPGDANILAELCRFSNTAGLRHHGVFVERIGLIDPLTAISALVTSSYHWTGGRFEESVASCRRVCEMSSPASMFPIMAGAQLAVAGRRSEAAEILRRSADALEGTPLGREAAFLHYGLLGDRARAVPFAPPMDGAIQNEFAAMFTADAYAAIGSRDEAIRWVRNAVARGFINYPFLAEFDPFLTTIRNGPEFERLLADVKPRWEAVVEWERKRQT